MSPQINNDFNNLFKQRILEPLELEETNFSDVDWTPQDPGGTNFKTHKLVVIDNEQIKFIGTIGYTLFGFFFLSIGIFFFVFGFRDGIFSKELFKIILFLIFCGTFIFIALNVLYEIHRPIIFDKRSSLYWKGREKPIWLLNLLFPRDNQVIIDLDDIIAIQIIREYLSNDGDNFFSYEVNLVRKDKSRLNVIDHGDLKSIKKDAHDLAEFLDLPILIGLDFKSLVKEKS